VSLLASPWLGPTELAADVRVIRDAGVLWYLGALTSEGDRVDNDCRPVETLNEGGVGPMPPASRHHAGSRGHPAAR
jgi:hypothetical protein